MITDVETYAIRLKPGDDLKSSIQAFVAGNHIRAGWIITCVGSLRQYCLRFANQQSPDRKEEFLEILTLSGTLGTDGCHLHIALSDSRGAVIGGHLMEGCIIYTTAEIIIGRAPQLMFRRENDGTTNWKELQIGYATNTTSPA